MGNLNYMQMVDFALGFAGIDIAGDDGRELGLWPWETEGELAPSPGSVWIRETFFGLEQKPEADGRPAAGAPARLAPRQELIIP